MVHRELQLYDSLQTFLHPRVEGWIVYPEKRLSAAREHHDEL